MHRRTAILAALALIILTSFSNVSAQTLLAKSAELTNVVKDFNSRSLPYLNTALLAKNSTIALRGQTDIFNYQHSGALTLDLTDLSEDQKVAQYWIISSEQGNGDDSFISGYSANRGLTAYTVEASKDGVNWELAPLAAAPPETAFIGNVVTGNSKRSTCHLFDLQGFSFARINVTEGRGWQGGQISVNLNIYDGSSCQTIDDWNHIDHITYIGDSTVELAGAWVNDFGSGLATAAHPHPFFHWFGQPFALTAHFTGNLDFYKEILREKQGRFVMIGLGSNDIPAGGINGYLSGLNALVETAKSLGKVVLINNQLHPTGPVDANGNNIDDGSAPAKVRIAHDDATTLGKTLTQYLKKKYNGNGAYFCADLEKASRINPGMMRPVDLHESDTGAYRAVVTEAAHRIVFSKRQGVSRNTSRETR